MPTTKSRSTESTSLLRYPSPGDSPAESANECQFDKSSSTASTNDHSDLSSLIPDRYRILDKLASGGMGQIFRARDLVLKRTVAIKVLLKRLQGNGQSRRRFVEEALIMGDLQNPGVAPIFDLGELGDGCPFFAMKLVEGVSFRDMLTSRNHPRDGLARHLRILEEVSQTIAFAHSRRVIHRDLKPLNIMVGIFGEVFVMDWGLSKRIASPLRLQSDSLVHAYGADSASTPRPANDECMAATDGELSRWGEILGTPEYLAPEQVTVAHHPVDVRTDVFGLGAMLCEILTGKPPYWHESPQELVRLALAADLTPAYSRLAQCGLPRNLVNLAVECLQREPDRRPSDPSIVANAIAQHLESSVRVAESDLARFFEFSQDLFCIAGFDGHFRRVNPTFTNTLHFTEDQLFARPFMEFVHPDDRAATEIAIARLAADEPVVAFFNRCLDANGSYHTMEWSGKSNLSQGVFYSVGRVIRHAQ